MADFVSKLLNKVLVQSLKDTGYKLEEKRTDGPDFGCHDPCNETNYVIVSKKIYDNSIFGFGSQQVVPEAAKRLEQQLVGLIANPEFNPHTDPYFTCSSQIVFIDKHVWYFDSPAEYYSFHVLFNLKCSGDVFSGSVSHELSSTYRIASFRVSADTKGDTAYALMRQVYETFVPPDTSD